MAAPLGNDFGKGFGRPRRLATELQRLREAAQHVDNLLEQHAVIDLLAKRPTSPLPADLLRAAAALKAEITEVEAAASLVESIMGDQWPENAAPRRRRRALGGDGTEQAIMLAAVALDRLISGTEFRQ